MVKIYKKNGYRFLGLSDHNIYNRFSELETEDFLLFPAIERDVNVTGEVMKCFHIVGMGYDRSTGNSRYKEGQLFKAPSWEGLRTVQNIIDDLNEHANMPIIAHPVWSRDEMPDLTSLTGYAGVEIYNNVCEIEWHQGYAELYWDLLLKRGIKVWGFASDDTHDYTKHACGGWIVVKAKELTYSSIHDAIISGSFYSSTGPEIYDFYLEGNQAVVKCSPACAIHFITYDNLGKSFYSGNKELTECSYTLQGVEKFVRVEIVDGKGKKAWSNPIFPEHTAI